MGENSDRISIAQRKLEQFKYTPSTSTTDSLNTMLPEYTEEVFVDAPTDVISNLADGETAVSDDTSTAEKRSRPISSDSSLRLSPSSKKVIYDGEQELYTFDEEPPFWVPMLFKIMDKVNANVSELKESLNTVSSTLTHVQDSFNSYRTATNEKIAELEKSVEFFSAEYETQKAVNESFKAEIEILKQKDDAQEQYSRRNCLVLHGIPEKENESTDGLFIKHIKENLGVNLQPSDLDRSHRIGRTGKTGKNGKQLHRAIIVKFTRYNDRARVFAAKRKLKGTNTMLTESLTQRRIGMFNNARLKYKDNCWTSDGEIMAKIENKTVNITNKI